MWIELRKIGRVEAQPDRDALAGEPVEFFLGVRVVLEDRRAIADDAHRHAGCEAVRDGDRNCVLAQVPARDVEADRFLVDVLHQDIGHVGRLGKVDRVAGRGGGGPQQGEAHEYGAGRKEAKTG